MLCRLAILAAATVAAPLPALALDSPARDSIDALIEAQAKANHVPASLVHRVVKRESNYNPGAVGRGGALGLMQIKHATARGLGYKGSPSGLLDAKTNLTYAVAYLAGAYRTAKGNEAQAYSYYARGYYYAAKRQGVSTEVAETEAVAPATPAAAFASTGLGQFFARNFTGPVARPTAKPTTVASADAVVAVPAAPSASSTSASTSPFAAAQGGSLGAQPTAEAPAVAMAYAQPVTSPAAQPAAAAAPQAGAEAAVEETAISVPLPPRRPHEFRLFAKKPAVTGPKTAEVLGLRTSAEAPAAQ